jgi:hypothetical protein
LGVARGGDRHLRDRPETPSDVVELAGVRQVWVGQAASEARQPSRDARTIVTRVATADLGRLSMRGRGEMGPEEAAFDPAAVWGEAVAVEVDGYRRLHDCIELCRWNSQNSHQLSRGKSRRRP